MRRLRRLGLPRRVLFLCHGNICRSPYAAAVFGARCEGVSRGTVRASSAGFFGPGRSSPESAIRAAARRAIDLRDHVSDLASQELLGDTDLILVMDERQQAKVWNAARRRAELLGDFDPKPIERRAIRDPVDQAEEVYEAVYERIDRCIESIVGLFEGAACSDDPFRASR